MPPRPDRSTVRSVGQLVVDVTLLLPVLVILTCGLAEVSRAVIIHQAMQNAVESTTGTEHPAGTAADFERSVRSTVAGALGTGTDLIDVQSDGDVVSVTLSGASLGPGPVRFLEGTTLVASSANRQ